MQRLGLAIVVALLTFGASGVSALVVGEPCTTDEQPGREDGACPPTCATCGCCAQAAEPVLLSMAMSHEDPVAEVEALIPRLPKPDPRDIFHVPRPRSA